MLKIQLNHVFRKLFEKRKYSVKDFHLDIEEKEFMCRWSFRLREIDNFKDDCRSGRYNGR